MCHCDSLRCVALEMVPLYPGSYIHWSPQSESEQDRTKLTNVQNPLSSIYGHKYFERGCWWTYFFSQNNPQFGAEYFVYKVCKRFWKCGLIHIHENSLTQVFLFESLHSILVNYSIIRNIYKCVCACVAKNTHIFSRQRIRKISSFWGAIQCILVGMNI